MRDELTIAIPTRNRPHRLRACLAALRPVDATVIVVDDGSVDAAAVRDAAAGAELIRQEPRGVSAARNRAAAEAQTPFVAFTDDDCIPSVGWAERLLAALQAGADVAVGPTLPGEGALTAALQVVSDAPTRGSDAVYAPASNFACRRDALLAVPFDEWFARTAAEDRDWFERLRAARRLVVTVPDAVVHHRPGLSLGGFIGRSFRYGRGAYRFRQRHRGGRLDPPAFYAGLAKDGLRKGPLVAALVLLAQAATAAGYAAEAAAERAERRRGGRAG